MSLERIRTDDKAREVWTYLELFTTEAYAKERLSAMHKDLKQDDLETRAFWIGSCVRQAREYYHAASSVSMLTKPLLLYYGMYSLAKAFIFLYNPMISLGAISHHGLVKPTIDYRAERLLEANTKSCRGIFRQLSKYALTNRCVIRGSEAYYLSTTTDVSFPFNCCFTELSEARIFTLEELLMTLPELFEFLLEVGIENRELLKVDIDLYRNISGNWLRTLAIYKPRNKATTKSFLQNKFPEINIPGERIKEDDQCFVFQRSLHDDYSTLIPRPLVQASSGQLFLILNDSPISDINVHFAVMFLLSNIVRYKPPLWQQIIETTQKSVISKFLSISELKFPNLILNELLQRSFVFVKE